MTNTEMPTPPEGTFWRICKEDGDLRVELRRKHSFWPSTLVAQTWVFAADLRSSMTMEKYEFPHWNAQLVVQRAERLLQEKLPWVAVDVNGLRGAQLGYGVTGTGEKDWLK